MIENETKLKTNPRMAMPYRALADMSTQKRQEIREQANAFLEAFAD